MFLHWEYVRQGIRREWKRIKEKQEERKREKERKRMKERERVNKP